MTYFDKETIAKAREIDLLSYLECADPFELVKNGPNSYKTKSHDSLKISNGKWYWWSKGVGGSSAIDYLVNVKGLLFTDAIEMVIKNGFVDNEYCPPLPTTNKELVLPSKHFSSDKVLIYLTGRGIDKGIVKSLIKSGHIYENHRNVSGVRKPYINAVFVGFDENDISKYASIRGIDSDYKGEAKGSDKSYSFSVSPNTKISKLSIFESAIDLLSYMTLNMMENKPYMNEHLLSLGGVYLPKKESAKVPESIIRYTKSHPEIKEISLNLDNDSAGRISSESLISALSKKYVCTDNPPKFGKDYNDYLISVVNERRKIDEVKIGRER